MSAVVENPRGGCVLAGINNVLGAMKGACPIYHSGPGCCMQTSAEQEVSGIKTAPFVTSVSIPCSNMLEKEVVFGGVEKLETTVQGAIDIIDAEAYFILTGCTAGIIGDDVIGVAEDFRSRGEEVYYIDTPGFAGNSDLGYEKIWEALIDQMMEPKETEEHLVNLFGVVPYHDPFWSGNLEELARILRRLGLKVHTFYTDGQGIAEVKEAPRAALNIITSTWLFEKPARKFEEKLGVPYIRYPGLPVGATDTTRFIRQVAGALSLDEALVDRVIAEEEAYVYGYLAQAIGALSWKRFAVVGDSSSAVGIARYLANDYSFTPRVVVISEPVFRKEGIEIIKSELNNLEYATPPKIVFAPDQFQIDRALAQDEDLTLIVGSSNERDIASEKGIQCVAVSYPLNDRLIFNRAIAGYRGSLTLTEDLYDNL